MKKKKIKRKKGRRKKEVRRKRKGEEKKKEVFVEDKLSQLIQKGEREGLCYFFRNFIFFSRS
jgi:hypothetical protein